MKSSLQMPRTQLPTLSSPRCRIVITQRGYGHQQPEFIVAKAQDTLSHTVITQLPHCHHTMWVWTQTTLIHRCQGPIHNFPHCHHPGAALSSHNVGMDTSNLNSSLSMPRAQFPTWSSPRCRIVITQCGYVHKQPEFLVVNAQDTISHIVITPLPHCHHTMWVWTQTT